ncbi:mechanosensitive ion channel family protein [Thiomonas sp. FB-6]|uniref:mechanosensitive ion channel family protein n=1 Tax=Thiomonas sp. FB-6 TaxID=1158291 RepID=UPI00036EE357|nr:mechanosensitive ion channel family protein [Thiomonas sp. FB-6]
MLQAMSHWTHLMIASNPLSAWLEALAWLLVVGVGAASAKPVLVRRLRDIAERTPSRWDDAFVHALDGTRSWLLALGAVLPAVRALDLPAQPRQWLEGAASVALAVQVGLWTGRFIDKLITQSRESAMRTDPETATGLAAMSFLARLVLWSLLFLLLLDNLGFNVSTLLAGLGVGGIAVGLALQNILGDLFSSLSIVLDKPFQIGHFIVIDGFSGTVENIGLKTTRIRSIGGELLVFSNTDLTKARLRNYRHMQERRISFAFGVGYETPPDLMEQIPARVREAVQKQEQTRFDRAHFKDFGESALNFEVVYWMTTSDYTVYMDTQQAINLELMRAFASLGVGFAFPTRTVQLSADRPIPVSWQGAGPAPAEQAGGG